MCHVFPRDMVLPTSIDVYRHEHAKPQRIRLNGDLVVADDPTPSPFLPAVGRDELCWAVSYERVARVVQDLQAMADRLVPDKPRLSDMRWSSIVSSACGSPIAIGRPRLHRGDEAHIHPPTGGQGMNTGVQVPIISPGNWP
jgi:2-polyprenyl-6-methoxyphenol hydroxylase-like FAD-dependent oxidoreductase